MANVRVNFTLPLEIITCLDEYGKGGGNRSGLVAALLRGYFEGDIGNNGNSAKVALMHKRIEMLSSELTELRSALADTSSRLQEAKGKNDEKNDEIRFKIREWFNVAAYDGIAGWLSDQGRDGPQAARTTITRGLRTIAEKNGVSLPKTIALFKDVYPPLAEFVDDPGAGVM